MWALPCISKKAKNILRYPRLMVGLHYLKRAYDENDESMVACLLENSYWQYFCGREYLSISAGRSDLNEVLAQTNRPEKYGATPQ